MAKKSKSTVSGTARAATSMFDCACFNVRQAARAITSLYDEVLEPTGLKTTQFAILLTIHLDAGTTMQSLATELGLDPSTMTRTLRPLLDERLVETRAGEGDRRKKQLAVTSLGRHRLGQCGLQWQKAQERLSERVGKEVFDRLIGDLSAVNKALRE
jgi:DNA-binding MarR family transcriptional regulator